jgi:hypothetical protein
MRPCEHSGRSTALAVAPGSALISLLSRDQLRKPRAEEEEKKAYQDGDPARDRIGPHSASWQAGKSHGRHDSGYKLGQTLNNQPNG